MMDYILRAWVSANVERAKAAWILGGGERWQPGKKLKLLFAGYNGTRNTGSDIRPEETLRQLPAVTSVQHQGAGMFRILTGNGSQTTTQLVEAAVLKKAPHGPYEASRIATEAQGMMAMLPREGITQFDRGVPCVHGGREIVVAERRESLDVEVGRAPCGRAAEAGAGDAEFGNDVVAVGALGAVLHDQARDGA